MVDEKKKPVVKKSVVSKTAVSPKSVIEASDALSTVLENPGESFIRTPGRTHNRIRSPR